MSSVPQRIGQCALIVAGVAFARPAALHAADVERAIVTVRVYQTAGLSPAMQQRALDEAEEVLRSAVVKVRWRTCRSTDPQRPASCDQPIGSFEKVLRIVGEGTSAPTPATLGQALYDRRARGGVLATVYLDRIVQLARTSGTDAVVLLGRAVAHELGHLLMNTLAHPRHGVMRPTWTPEEVRRNRLTDWVFTSSDAIAMRRPSPRSQSRNRSRCNCWPGSQA